MAWYRVGTASFTNGSAAVTGSGTAWIANAKVGDGMRGPDGRVYEILAVVSDTAITLAETYASATAAGAAYAIMPTQGHVRDLTAPVQQLIIDIAAMLNGAGAGRFSDGTSGAPGISFANDIDTGLYRLAANVLGFAVGGNLRMTLENGGLTIGSGALQALLTLWTSGDGFVQYLRRGGATNNPGLGFNLIEGTNEIQMVLASSTTSPILRRMTGGGDEIDRVDSAGNAVTTLRASAPTLTANGMFALSAVSNTTVRLSYRGSDGVTRTTTLNVS